MTFRTRGKDYRGQSALEIVRQMEQDAPGYPHAGRPIRQFLRWSLDELSSHVPPRDLDLSDRLEDETLALSYLCLRDEYGAGELLVAAPR